MANVEPLVARRSVTRRVEPARPAIDVVLPATGSAAGVGAVGAFVVGVIVLGEQMTVMRVIAAVMIVGGLVLMKLSSSH